MKLRMVSRLPVNGAMPIYYCLKSKVPITPHCQLGSTRYTQQYKSRIFLCYQSRLFLFIFADIESVDLVVRNT